MYMSHKWSSFGVAVAAATWGSATAAAQEGRGAAPRIEAGGSYDPRSGGRLDVVANAEVVDGLFFNWDPETKTATWRRVGASAGTLNNASIISWRSPLANSEREELEQLFGIRLRPYDLLEVHPEDGGLIYRDHFGTEKRRGATKQSTKPERTVEVENGKSNTHAAVTIEPRMFVYAPENLQTGVAGFPHALPAYPGDRWAARRRPRRETSEQPGEWRAQYETRYSKEYVGPGEWYITDEPTPPVRVTGLSVDFFVTGLRRDAEYRDVPYRVRLQDEWVTLPWPDLGELWVDDRPQPRGTEFYSGQQQQTQTFRRPWQPAVQRSRGFGRLNNKRR